MSEETQYLKCDHGWTAADQCGPNGICAFYFRDKISTLEAEKAKMGAQLEEAWTKLQEEIAANGELSDTVAKLLYAARKAGECMKRAESNDWLVEAMDILKPWLKP